MLKVKRTTMPFLDKQKTGHWPIPKSVLAAGIEGQTVVLCYSERGMSTIFTGICVSKEVTGATRNNQDRYRLTVAKHWKMEGTTDVTFSRFFAGFTMNANPTVVWGTPLNYLAPLDGEGENEGNRDDSDPDDDGQKDVGGTNIMALVALRARHDLFVKRVTKVWGKKCALTGLNAPRLIQACHLVPWADAAPLERTSGNNGLMLCAHLHALLDSHLLSFDDEGGLMLASDLDEGLRNLVLAGGSVRLRQVPAEEQLVFLQRHRAAAALKGQELTSVAA